jgi:hypothetical protein
MAPTIQGIESMTNATTRANARALPETTNRRAVLRGILAGSAAAAATLPASLANASAPADPSAVSSGSELVTLEQMAAMNFEPWSHTEGEWTPPSNEQWAADALYVLVPTRVAWISMYKTKAELEAIVIALLDDKGSFETLVKGIIDAREYLEMLTGVLNAAECRIMCAASAVEYREGGPDEEGEA